MSERAYGTKNEEKMQELASDFSVRLYAVDSFAIKKEKNLRKESKNLYLTPREDLRKQPVRANDEWKRSRQDGEADLF
jgi:hypothetical protein